ncbi:hypothetical protein V1478_012556 [Vespula squamosa]|uniref:Uncharacterized protein n=1 Tax=Vespula squamosa TaxID=30214 RepID=A0ABD2ADS5_VESSQ
MIKIQEMPSHFSYNDTVVLKENVSEQEREKRARQGRADSDVDSCVGVALPPFETREEALLEVAYREK